MNTFFLVIAVMVAGAAVAFLFVLIFFFKFKKHEKPIEIINYVSGIIRDCTKTYLRQQYKLGIAVLLILSLGLFILYYFDFVTIYTIFAAISGFVFSMIVGSFGVYIAVRANALIASDSNISLKKAKNTSALAGNIAGLFAHGFILLDLAFWMAIIHFCEKDIIGDSVVATFSILSTIVVTFGIGASSYALIARVGGGVFTKGADVGSDWAGKFEMGLEEDSPLNPGTNADNVGDNVGDINGGFADLYETLVDALVTSMVIITVFFANDPKMLVNAMLLLFSLVSFGVVSSLLGMFFSRAKNNNEKKIISLNQKGLLLSTLILAVFSLVASYFTVGLIMAFPIILGLFGANILSFLFEYFNSSAYSPVKRLVKMANQGTSLLTTANIANGKTSAGVIVLVLALIFMVPIRIFLPNELFDVSLTFMVVAMLSNFSLILSQDAEGPMGDNAQGINEMTKASDFAIKNTNVLDAIGNTSAAKLKGFAIGAAALTGFLLFLAYIESAKIIFTNFNLDPKMLDFSFENPDVMIGLLFGGALIFILNGNLISAVVRVAKKLVDYIREQLKEIFSAREKGEKKDPDSKPVIKALTKAAQKSLLFPLVLAVLGAVIPALIGGPSMVVGTLAGLTLVGVLSSLFQSNMGGSADNTKKAIEAGAEGGKNSPAHKSAVVIDTVGDPLKDTSGPAINIFIKLVSMISIVILGLIVYVKYVM